MASSRATCWTCSRAGGQVAGGGRGGGDGALRYRMLEPIRQYARERLEASGRVYNVPTGEAERVRERHAQVLPGGGCRRGGSEGGRALIW